MRIPPSMEVKSEEHRAMKEELTGTSSDTFIVQQRGLNEDLPEAQDTYARIMMGYSCAGENGETTRVNVYAFPCNDRLVRVTISFRVSDASMWGDDLELALSTFEFE